MTEADIEQVREWCRQIKAAFGPGVVITVKVKNNPQNEARAA